MHILLPRRYGNGQKNFSLIQRFKVIHNFKGPVQFEIIYENWLGRQGQLEAEKGRIGLASDDEVDGSSPNWKDEKTLKKYPPRKLKWKIQDFVLVVVMAYFKRPRTRFLSLSLLWLNISVCASFFSVCLSLYLFLFLFISSLVSHFNQLSSSAYVVNTTFSFPLCFYVSVRSLHFVSLSLSLSLAVYNIRGILLIRVSSLWKWSIS